MAKSTSGVTRRKSLSDKLFAITQQSIQQQRQAQELVNEGARKELQKMLEEAWLKICVDMEAAAPEGYSAKFSFENPSFIGATPYELHTSTGQFLRRKDVGYRSVFS